MVRSIAEMQIASLDDAGMVVDLSRPFLAFLGLSVLPEGFTEEELVGHVRRTDPNAEIKSLVFSDGTALIVVISGRSSLRALVVDDNAFQRQILGDICRELGLQVEVYADAEALLAGGEVADLLVVDMQLPGMNGLEAARSMRQSRRAQKIVLLTASVDRLDSVDVGAVDLILGKPVDIGRLRALVRGEDAASCSLPSPLPFDPQQIFAFSIPGTDSPDREVSARYAQLLAEDLVERLNELVELVQKWDLGGIVAAAHSIRGLAGHLTDESISREAARLEESVCSMSRDEIVSVVEELAGKLAPVRGWLSRHLEGG